MGKSAHLFLSLFFSFLLLLELRDLQKTETIVTTRPEPDRRRAGLLRTGGSWPKDMYKLMVTAGYSGGPHWPMKRGRGSWGSGKLGKLEVQD